MVSRSERTQSVSADDPALRGSPPAFARRVFVPEGQARDERRKSIACCSRDRGSVGGSLQLRECVGPEDQYSDQKRSDRTEQYATGGHILGLLYQGMELG